MSSDTDVVLTTESLRTTPAVIASQREAVVAEGPDAQVFLQGQLSQDIAALAPGEASRSLLLHPQGKISAWVRITRVTDERFVIDVDAGWADEVLTRLNRFKLRTKCDLVIAPWASFTVVGRGADDVVVADIDHDMIDSWAGVPVRDVFGSALSRASFAGLATLDPAVFTALRIEAGRPRMGAELDDSTIPAAAGIVDQSVSFTKGCYTGQELVARIDSRGNNVPRRLVGLVCDSTVDEATALALSGTEVSADSQVIGVVTSAAWSGQMGAAVALAYVGRACEIGQRVHVGAGAGEPNGELRSLPLILV